MSYRQTGDRKVKDKIEALEDYVENKVPKFELPSQFSLNWFLEHWDEPEKGFYKVSKNLASVKTEGHLRPSIMKALADAKATREAIERIGKKSISQDEKDLRLENEALKRKLSSLGQSVFDLMQENRHLRETLGERQAGFVDSVKAHNFGGRNG